MITFRSAVDYLQSNGYLTIVNGQVFITSKFQREVSTVPTEKLVMKEKEVVLTKKDIWDKFMRDADIPHKATASDGRSYTIRQFSPAIQDTLIKVIKEVDSYEILTQATKLYYRSNSFKLTFKNYLEREVWRGEYDRLDRAAKDPRTLQAHLDLGSGKSKFED